MKTLFALLLLGIFLYACSDSNGNKTIEECKGKLVNDYQQYLESNWVSELKKEYVVKVNQDVFEKVKKQIKK